MQSTEKGFAWLWLFLLGLGLQTKVVLIGVVSFSELVMFAMAPYLWIKHWRELRRIGLLPILIFSFAMTIGNYVCSVYNNTGIFMFIKDAATYYSIFAMVTVYVWVISHNGFRSVGWFVFGNFLSGIIAIFAFNPTVHASLEGSYTLDAVSADEVIGGIIFWCGRVKRLLTVPVAAFYLKMPLWLSLFFIVGSSVFSALISTSGRGTAALGLLAAGLIFVGGRSARKMARVGKYFWLFLVGGLIAVVLIKNLYTYTASHGLLGDEARNKYHRQVHGKGDLLSVLIGGRTEFFVAIQAVLDSPIIGIGRAAVDTKGYYAQLISKYGESEDIVQYERALIRNGGIPYVPQHSCLTSFWAQTGISAVFFWGYVLYLMFLYVKKYAAAIPQWFGWLSCLLFTNIFTIFFNPYSREFMPIMIALLILAKAVGERKLSLPLEVIREAHKHDR